ncbi:acetyl-CoA carboxylase biotin carboxylase subunit family protein [Streptomyces sp. NPDC059568]|uniref:ATP-grasp domain-containing protein n=1 Tax=Streptomyces sp. NPDC059568 TaxID=3346868 RepID=UPI00368CF572
MTKLLVVGAGPMRSAAFAVWRGMGLSVVLADGYSAARYEHLADEFVPLDPRDGSADLKAVTELARQCDGIVTLSDDSQGTVAAVAEAVGLPGIGSPAATAARSKSLQRALCERAGMFVPRWRTVRGPGDLKEFFADGGRAAVLKPVDSAGSAGVLRVGTYEEALRQWPVVRSLSPSRTAVVEDFIEGREVCVEAVVSGGEPVFVSVTGKEVRGPLGFVVVSLSFAAEQPDRAAAERFIRRLVAAVGLSDGIVHAECKVEGARWGLVEAGFRPGGDLIADLTARVTGVHTYRALAQIAVGDKPTTASTAAAAGAAAPSALSAPFAQIRFLTGEGLVRQFVPPARVLEGLPDVRVVNQMFAAGQRVRHPLGNSGRAGYAAGWGTDPAALDEQLRCALDRLGGEMGLAVHGAEAAGNHAAA